MEIKAHAKINLFLSIGKRRGDGYHDVTSVMQTISLCDDIALEVSHRAFSNDGRRIIVTGNGAALPPDNTAYRAALEFVRYAGLQDKYVKCDIKKNIPLCSGLGGGSADAAAVLRGLDILCRTKYSSEVLRSLGAAVGSDVPFCVTGGTKLATGRGEILNDAPAMPDCCILIAHKPGKRSTAAAYETLDRSEPGNTIAPDSMIKALEKKDIVSVCGALHNDFETALPCDGEARRIMTENGALGVLLSGSGSAVFGIFADSFAAEAAKFALSDSGFFASLAKPEGELALQPDV